MNSIGEAILLLNWIKESGILTSTDYGFLVNLYIETIHLAEKQPSDEEGRRMQRQLYRKASQISQRIDDVEQQIDVFVAEYFEATAAEIADEENDWEEEKDYRRRLRETRNISIEWKWTVQSVEGPIGEVPSTNEYDFTEFESGDIDAIVSEWAETYASEIEEHIDLDSEGSGYETWNQTLSIDFDDELAPITVNLNVELNVSWSEGDFDREAWEEY